MADIFRKTKGLQLIQLLESRTKAELMEIVRVLDFHEYSGLSKNELVEKLAEDIPDEFRFIINIIDWRIYDSLHSLSTNEGLALAEEFPAILGARLMNVSMIFPVMIDNTRIFAMPDELAEIFREADTEALAETARSNHEVVLLAQGLLSRYGAMDTDCLIRMINGYLDESIDEETIYEILNMTAVANDLIEVENFFCNHTFCEDIRSVLIGTMEFRDLEYRRYTKKQILEYSMLDYYEYTPAVVRFKEFVNRYYNISEQDLDQRILYLLFQFAADVDMKIIVGFLLRELEGFSDDAMEEFSKIIADLSNSTGKWALKGYSPDEMKEIEKNGSLSYDTEDKPRLTLIKSRNLQPCPCGSGKLYKDCCGRK